MLAGPALLPARRIYSFPGRARARSLPPFAASPALRRPDRAGFARRSRLSGRPVGTGDSADCIHPGRATGARNRWRPDVSRRMRRCGLRMARIDAFYAPIDDSEKA